MPFRLALIAAFGCSLCIGVAAVLEKVSADREARVSSLQIGLLLRLLDDWPYVLGLALDGASFLLNDYRLRSIIRTYSDHISLPIVMPPGEGTEEKPVNQASALWARPKKIGRA